MGKKINKEKILDLVRNKGLTLAQVRRKFRLTDKQLRSIIKVREMMSAWNEWARVEVEARYLEGQTFDKINKDFGWNGNKANSLFTSEERKALRYKRLEKVRPKVVKDYLRGLTQEELSSRYGMSKPQLRPLLEGIEKPKLIHNVVPMIIDHYNGDTVDDLSIKYDLDPVFIEKHLDRQKEVSSKGVVYYDVVVDYCINNMSLKDLSAKHGVSKQCWMSHLKTYGYVSHREDKIANLPVQDVVDAYESGESIQSLVSTHHLSHPSIKKILIENGVVLREWMLSTEQRKRIVDLYAQFKTAKQISKEIGTSQETVFRVLNENAVTIRKARDYNTNSNPVYLPRDEIITLKAEGLSWEDLADKYGVCSTTVRNHVNGKVKYKPKYHDPQPRYTPHPPTRPKTPLAPSPPEVQEIIQAFEQGADLQEIVKRFGDQIKKMVD